MKYLLLSCILLFTLSSCGDAEAEASKAKVAQQAKLIQEAQAQKDALLKEIQAKDAALAKAREEAKDTQAKLLAQEQAKKEAFLKEEAAKKAAQEHLAKEKIANAKLSNVGVHVEEDTITIDTKKTKDFFEQLGKTFQDKIQKMTKELDKGIINEEDAGVKIDETHINIDLNKTKDFLETWGKKMQGFVKEFDSMAKEMDANIKPLENTHTQGN